MGWEFVKLGDLVHRKIGYGIVQPGANVDVGVPVIKVNNIISGLSNIELLEKTTTDIDARYTRTRLVGGELVISLVGSVGKTAIVPKTFAGCNLVRATGLIDIKDEILAKWVKYYIDSPQGQAYINSNVNTTVQVTLNIKSLSDMPIPLPDHAIREKIVAILSSLDDKIELNRRINANLEQQAQALYKSWFVDNKKDDWKAVPLSEVADFVGGYSYKGNELVESSMTAMATIKNFERKGGFKVDGFKDIVASNKLKAEHHANLFDILVAHTDLTQNADVIGNAEMLLTFDKYSDIIFSMDLVKVLPKQTFPYKYLLAALLKNPHFKKHCMGYVNGTTVLHMSKKALPEYVINLPSAEEIQSMDNAFKAYYLKMAEILQENNNLFTLRDTLLPKLMSGEITV